MDPEVLRALLSVLSKNGGLDLSSALGDPYLAYIAGSYQPDPMKSEGDIYAEVAPTLMSVAETEPMGSWRQTAASSIASGVPAYRVKEDVLRTASENPDALGLTTTDEASRFIDELAAENQRAQNELTKQAERKDPFQKAGLPGANQVFTPEDVVNMNPDLFAGILNREMPSEMKNRLDAIRKYGERTVMREERERSPELDAKAQTAQNKRRIESSQVARLAISNGIARQYGLTQAQVMNPDTTDLRQVRANEEYRAQSERSAFVPGSATPDVPSPLGKAALLSVPLSGGIPLLPVAETIWKGLSYNPDAARRRREEEELAKTQPPVEKKPKMVVSKSATEALRREANEAALLVSRMRGGEEYNQRVAAAMAERLSQRMAESGRTPLSDALIRTAIVSRQLRK